MEPRSGEVMTCFEPWVLGHPGVGYLVRVPEDESLRLEVVIADHDLNPITLMLHVSRLYDIPATETFRLMTLIVVRPDGTFMLPKQFFNDRGDREQAAMVEWTDRRLRWEGRT